MEERKIWLIPKKILERRDLNMTEKILISVLGILGAYEGPIFHRQSWLAGKMGVSKRTIRRALKNLTRIGILQPVGDGWRIVE